MSSARACHFWGRKPKWHLGAPVTALLCAQGNEKTNSKKGEKPNGVHAMKKAFPTLWYPCQSEDNYACAVLVEPVSGSMDQ